MTRVIFVCTGNTCRSPLAEALARREATRRGLTLQVGSAGTFAADGAPAALPSIRAADRRGADLTQHRARPLTRELLEEAGLAVAMSPAHAHAVRDLDPRIRVVLATDFLDPEHPQHGSAVPDPFGGSQQDYEEVAEVLETCVAGMLDRLTGSS